MSQADLEALMNALLPFAEQMLEDSGEFYPFAAWMRRDGQIEHQAATAGDEHPSAQALIALLTAGLQHEAAQGDLRAAGLCLDGRVVPPDTNEKTDAICVQLEHATGEAIAIYLPYAKQASGEIVYGALFASAGSSRFFPAPTEGENQPR